MAETQNSVVLQAPLITVPLPGSTIKTSNSGTQLKWQKAAKIVAWIDIVLMALRLAIFGPISVGVTYLAVGTDRLKWNETFHEINPALTAENWDLILGVTVAVLYVYLIFLCLSIWAGNKLRVATNLSFKDPGGARNKAMIWMILNITIFILALSSLVVFFYSQWTAWFVILWNISELVIVYMYMKELRSIGMPGHKYISEKEEVAIDM